MSMNILDSIKGYLTPDLMSRASTALGENESSISKAFSGILPAVLGGIITKATTGNGANDVLKMAQEHHGTGALTSLGSLLTNPSTTGGGSGLLSGLFGDKLSAIVSAIAGFAGIKSSSVTSLMGVAAPAALGALGKHANDNNLDAGSLSSFLASQKNHVMSMLPAGLGSLLGLGSLGSGLSSVGTDVRNTATTTTNYAKDVAEKRPDVMKWLPLLLLLLGLAVAAWYFFLRKKDTDTTATTTTSDTTTTRMAAPMDTTKTTVMTTREMTKVKLPDGTMLDAYKGGIEDQLVSFLSTDWAAMPADQLKAKWFDFDNLNFKTASAEITPESQHQVDNLTAILKAFPKAKLKIGGYTDKVGNEATNKKLSADRATSVKAALAKAGVGAQITDAEGYGSSFAKYAADASEADRVKDRHVSVSVRS